MNWRRWLPSHLYGRLLLTYVALSLATLLAVSVTLTYLYQSYLVRTQTQDLVDVGRSLADLPNVQAYLATGTYSFFVPLDNLMNVLGPFIGANIVMLNSARVIAASTPGQQLGVTLSSQAVRQVLSGHIVTGGGRDFGLAGHSLAVAVPVEVAGTTVGAVILHRPVKGLQSTLGDTGRILLWAFLIAAAASALMAAFLSRGVGRPLDRLARAAGALARGDLDQRVPVEGPEELRQLARTYNRAAEQIGQTLADQRRLEQLRRDFVANVSHEFRAPLASLTGFMEMLEDGTIPPKESGHYFGLMRQDTERLTRLVSDLLDLSSLDAGKMAVHPEAVAALDACRQALAGTAAQARSAEVALAMADDAEAATLRADPQRLQQVLDNLLSNALRHTPVGGRVEVDVRRTDDGARISVADTGEGIPPEEIDLVWERFHRVDRARARMAGQAGGTGLGLAIVRQLVELQGGHVGVSSTPGQGATFWFTLPTL